MAITPSRRRWPCGLSGPGGAVLRVGCAVRRDRISPASANGWPPDSAELARSPLPWAETGAVFPLQAVAFDVFRVPVPCAVAAGRFRC